MFNTCFRCAKQTAAGALFCDACRAHLVGLTKDSIIEQEMSRKTKFYKAKGKCFAVFHDDKGFTSFELWDGLYREFQKWVKADMTATKDKGVYESDVKTQDKVRKMLKDHLDFPF